MAVTPLKPATLQAVDLTGADGAPTLTPEKDLDRLLDLLSRGTSYEDCAQLTGYKLGSVRSLAHRHKATIRQRTVERLGTGVGLRLEELHNICGDKDTPSSTRVQAIALWLKLADLEPPQKHDIRNTTDADIDARLLELCGGDPETVKKLIELVSGGKPGE